MDVPKDLPTDAPPPPVARRRAHPLGPLVSTRRMSSPRTGRLMAAGVLVACSALLGVAAWLHPDARGLGTHEQLGLRPCAFPQYVGIPCPSCGMTTAFAHTVRGHWLRALYTQPMGWLLCVATMVAVAVSAWSLLRGRVVEINWYRINPNTTVFCILLLFLAAWGFKIAVGLLDAAGQSG